MTTTPKVDPNQTLSIQRIYVKDSSFQSPQSPEIFKGQWKPEVKMELNIENKKLEDNIYEVILGITVTLHNESKDSCIVNVKQAGIFSINGFENDALGYVLGSYCPNTLFPFARETICDMIVRGGFPQLLLIPINFDAMYAQKQQQEKEQSEKKIINTDEPITIN